VAIDDLFRKRTYNEACLSSAHKQHARKRRIRDGAFTAATLAAILVPWFLNLDYSGILIWFVGVGVALAYRRTEQRLKTMQIRLAQMHDLLHRINGYRDSDEELMELVSEDGPVDPDPKLWSQEL
jgi:hypothetical protein